MSNPDALAILTDHFDALKPQRVEVDFFDFPLFYRPLNSEEALKLANARVERHPGKQAVMYAELIAATVQNEDGTLVFPLTKGGPNPVKVLTEKCDPRHFSILVEKLFYAFNHLGEAEELAKKSESQDAV